MSGASVFITADPFHTIAAAASFKFDGDDVGGAVKAVNSGEFYRTAREPDCLCGLHEGISMRVHAANDYGDLCGLLGTLFHQRFSIPDSSPKYGRREALAYGSHALFCRKVFRSGNSARKEPKQGDRLATIPCSFTELILMPVMWSPYSLARWLPPICGLKERRRARLHRAA